MQTPVLSFPSPTRAFGDRLRRDSAFSAVVTAPPLCYPWTLMSTLQDIIKDQNDPQPALFQGRGKSIQSQFVVCRGDDGHRPSILFIFLPSEVAFSGPIDHSVGKRVQIGVYFLHFVEIFRSRNPSPMDPQWDRRKFLRRWRCFPVVDDLICFHPRLAGRGRRRVWFLASPNPCTRGMAAPVTGSTRGGGTL